ncbi:phage tail protein [Brevibacterium antiquum]|uniref:Tape measure domain-containing protein n=1 Tax=Brevibacterium antiquum TaxID=234835 RepID=A0A2H1IPC5_9MICO|nr:tape measure protein [Brevibacterium antiquum]SMX76822.1 tape measure domain-containing protein [Brevibacterium antiquum]
MALNIGELVAYISVNAGKAYASISDFESRMTKAGQSASQKFQSVGQSITGVGQNIKGVGGQLTKGITAPVGGAALAVGGLTAALGWGRLKSVDTAQAQLKGLGYNTEDVNRITGQLTKALEGGMLTMGEATSAAASGMASGVEEGKELTRYIKVLDGAVAGSNGTFDEMNQIFARVQGSGKLMTGELDMIEQRMPGFSATMAKELGVPQEKLREMVSAGEISSDEFMDIMEGFAGDMATEYAKSWEGMVQNAKAYIGIIGEQLLGGVFEQSKDSIAEFIDWMKSDEVQAWAAETGQALGDAFSKILSGIKTVVTWFANLPGPVQKFALVLGGVAVAAGPVLLVIGTMVSTIGTLVTTFGTVIGVLAKIPAPLNILGGLFRMISPLLGLLKVGLLAVGGALKALWLTMLANPIVLIIAAVVAIVAALVWFFTQTETGKKMWSAFMDWLGQAWEWIKETAVTVWTAIVDAIVGAWEWIKTTSANIWNGFIDWIVGLWNSIVTWAATTFNNIVDAIVGAWDWIKTKTAEIWNGIISWIRDNWALVIGIITGPVGLAIAMVIKHWDKIKAVTAQVWNWILTKLKDIWTGIITSITNAVNKVKTWISDGWTWIKSTTAKLWNGIKLAMAKAIVAAVRTVQNKVNQIKNWIRNTWNSVKSTTSNAWNAIKNGVSNGINGAVNFVRQLPGRALSALGNIGSKLYNSGKAMIDGFKDGIVNAFNNAVNAVKNGLNRIRNFFPFSPAKEGPFSGKGYTIYSGQALTEDFAKGMSMAESDVVRQAEAITKAAAFEVPPVPGMSGPNLGGANGAGGQSASGVTNNFTVVNPVAEPTSETARKASAYIGVSI